MAISDNIRAIRKKKGLTQKQVGDASGLADATIRMYELGKANPKPATAAKIAKALDVSIAELYGVEWTEGLIVQSPEFSSTLYQAMLVDKGGALPIDFPYQDRLLAAYGRLNADGQLEAIRRIEELGQIPAYQSSPSLFDSLTEDERNEIKQCLGSLQGAELELRLMRERKPPVPDSHNAVVSAKARAAGRSERIAKILLRALDRQSGVSEHQEGAEPDGSDSFSWKTVCSYLKEARKRKRLSLQEVGDKSGLGEKIIQDIENDRRSLDAAELDRIAMELRCIAEALEVRLTDFLPFTDEDKANLNALYDSFEEGRLNWTEDEQKIVLDMHRQIFEEKVLSVITDLNTRGYR